MELIDALKWRYATKKMNGKKISDQDLNTIVEAAHLAPSSSGLQPFEIFVITDRDLLAKIQPIASGQSQITDCSALLVFAAWDNYSEEKIKSIFDYTLSERGLPADAMDAYRERLWAAYGSRDAEKNFEHAARQAYIAFGIAIAAAAELKIDSTPMEGFDNEKLDQLLDLPAKGLKSVTLLPLGYRDEENDWLVNLKKVRRPKESYIHYLS
ncbi:nitroreductase family protein [Olivibacter sitiensis]|uniref:nitroreductase family protein n=1 Tax=Olivibacter sitiensis TaxID=376470 RepID=UPI0004081425|nr:nitroreductase family protein [Olivibacter sitiensis]